MRLKAEDIMREAARNVGRAHKALAESEGDRAAAYLQFAAEQIKLARNLIEMARLNAQHTGKV